MERRYLQNDVEVRAVDDSTAVVSGHAAVFNRDSQPLGWFEPFIERIAPKAFKKTIKEADVRALFNHDPSFVLGRNKAGTLRLSEDEKGLKYEIDMDMENTDVRNVFRMIDRGDVSQSSFGFRVVKDEWDYDSEPIQRTIREVELFDVSPVTYPAYLDTDVEANDAFDSLAKQVERPVGEIKEAAKRGELRSYLLTPATDEPDTTTDEPATSHSEDREVVHSMPPSVRLKLMELDEDTAPPGAA